MWAGSASGPWMMMLARFVVCAEVLRVWANRPRLQEGNKFTAGDAVSLLASSVADEVCDDVSVDALGWIHTCMWEGCVSDTDVTPCMQQQQHQDETHGSRWGPVLESLLCELLCLIRLCEHTTATRTMR